MKKSVVGLGTLAAAALVLSGCGGGGFDDNAETPTTPKQRTLQSRYSSVHPARPKPAPLNRPSPPGPKNQAFPPK